MSYLKVKSGHLGFSGLKLEESDVDREEICSERLRQLLNMQTLLDSLPLTQNTMASQTKSRTQPSIPSSKATRFGILSNSWNFPKTEFARKMCRSADFYETRFRKPKRYASEPDLPQISKSEELKLPSILMSPKKNSPQMNEEFFIQGRNILPTVETEGHDSNHHTQGSSHVRIPTTTVTTHASHKFVHTTNNLVKKSKGVNGERNNSEMESPLTARQCFPSTETQKKSERNSTEKYMKSKIQPMERKLDSKLIKYVQCRFGRSLGPSTKEKTFAHAHSLGIGDWAKHDEKVQKRIEIERVAREKVVKKIVGCREKDYEKDVVTGKQKLVEFLSCSGLEQK